MRLGIIGLPKSGKTTVFETLTHNFSASRSGMESRIGTISVPDERVDVLSAMYEPKKTIFAQVEYFLPGKGENGRERIWNRVRDCDALVHVVRNFATCGKQISKTSDDFRQLDQELILADQIVVEKRLDNLSLEKKRGRKIDSLEVALLERCLANLEEETPLRRVPELASDRVLKGFTFLSAKPTLVLFNNGDNDASTPATGDTVERERCLAIRGKLEHEITQMAAKDAADFLQEYHIEMLAADRIVEESYKLLGLVSFFTVGEDEVRAWTIKRETAAVDAAETIHSDMKRGFIRAEVLSYDDLMEAGSYREARKRGTVRLEGKSYAVKDGDIVNFRFNV